MFTFLQKKEYERDFWWKMLQKIGTGWNRNALVLHKFYSNQFIYEVPFIAHAQNTL